MTKRATERMQSDLLQQQPTYYFPLDQEIDRIRSLSDGSDQDPGFDFSEIQAHLRTTQDLGSRDDEGKEGAEGKEMVPDSSTTFRRLMRGYCEMWTYLKLGRACPNRI